MKPFLIDVEMLGVRLSVPTGAVFTLLGLALGGALFWLLLDRSARRAGQVLFAAAAVAAALAGARFLGFALDLAAGSGRPSEAFAESGSTLLGGIAGGGACALLYQKLHRGGYVTRRSFDAAAVAVAAGVAVMRIGCFFEGCCFGNICAPSPFAVTYPPDWIMRRFFGFDIPPGPRLPFPFIASGSLLLIAFALFLLLRKAPRAGTAAASFLILFGVHRFAVEFIRDEPVRLFLGSLSFAQWFALACLPLGAGLLAYYRLKPETHGSPPARR